MSKSAELCRLENQLLTALPAEEYERLRPSPRAVTFSLGEVVYEVGVHLDYPGGDTTPNRLLYKSQAAPSAFRQECF
jgi:hypothetical protein